MKTDYLVFKYTGNDYANQKMHEIIGILPEEMFDGLSPANKRMVRAELRRDKIVGVVIGRNGGNPKPLGINLPQHYSHALKIKNGLLFRCTGWIIGIENPIRFINHNSFGKLPIEQLHQDSPRTSFYGVDV